MRSVKGRRLPKNIQATAREVAQLELGSPDEACKEHEAWLAVLNLKTTELTEALGATIGQTKISEGQRKALEDAASDVVNCIMVMDALGEIRVDKDNEGRSADMFDLWANTLRRLSKG